MGTHNSESNCEICGGRSHLVEDSRYDSREEHCLNAVSYTHLTLPTILLV